MPQGVMVQTIRHLHGGVATDYGDTCTLPKWNGVEVSIYVLCVIPAPVNSNQVDLKNMLKKLDQHAR